MNATIQFGAVKIDAPAGFLVGAILDKIMAGAHAPITIETTTPPKIGEVWQGGIYAGVARGLNGAPDYHLIVAKADGGELKWEEAKKWAANQGAPDYADFSLPTKEEAALLYANLADAFEKCWHWTSTQLASSAECAWIQGFYYGGQFSTHKSNAYRARAVRRIPIR